MTMMNILEVKGYLKKEKSDRAFVYRPAKPERAVISSMVREFVNRVFDGAPRALLLHLVKDGRLSEKERAELLRMIEETMMDPITHWIARYSLQLLVVVAAAALASLPLRHAPPRVALCRVAQRPHVSLAAAARSRRGPRRRSASG